MTDKRLQQIGVDFITRQHEKYTGFNISQTPKNEHIIKIIDNMESLNRNLPVISPLPDEYKIYNSKQQFKENLNQDVNSSQNYNSSSSRYESSSSTSSKKTNGKRRRESIDLTNENNEERVQMPPK